MRSKVEIWKVYREGNYTQLTDEERLVLLDIIIKEETFAYTSK